MRDELAAQDEQVAEHAEVRLLRGRRDEALKEAEAGEHSSIDTVILGLLSESLGEASRAQGVDQHGFQAGLEEALVEAPVVAPCGLQDSARDAVLAQPLAQGAVLYVTLFRQNLPNYSARRG